VDTNRANEIIIEVIQNALIGELDPSSNVNPRFIAEAIAAKVNFEKTNNGSKSDKIIGTLIDIIVKLRNEKNKDLKEIQDNTLLKNYALGRIDSYTELLDIINEL
jgi:hypothetical protein